MTGVRPFSAGDALVVVDANDLFIDWNQGARDWFTGAAFDLSALLGDRGVSLALVSARRDQTPLEVPVERIGEVGPCRVRVEPMWSKLVVLRWWLEGGDGLSALLERLSSEAELEPLLSAVLTYGRQSVPGIECTVSLLADDGSFKRVAGQEPGKHQGSASGLTALRDELGAKVCWSWPLRDVSGRTRGMLEAFSETPRLPTLVEADQLHVLAQLASLAIGKNYQTTELRDAVERFELVLGTTHHVIYDWDLTVNRLLWHARVGDAFGHWAATRDLEWWHETTHPEDRDQVERAFRAALASTQNDWSQTYRFRRANGGWAWVQDAGRFQRDEHGTALRLVGVMQDITEQRDLRSRLALSERLASVGTLAAGVAHEINNPLAWITSNVNFALEELDSIRKRPREVTEFADDLIDALEDARAGAERVGTIVRDLKTFSRAQDERVGAIDVRKVLESAITMAANEIRHRAHLVRELHEVPPVEGNEGRLSQVFLNLLLNAAHSLPENDASRHEISVVTGLDPSGRVVIEIRDTGSGIAPEVLHRIFDPFFTTRPVGQGTGLGLSVCHTIVGAMSGTIEVDSRVGVGSTFRVLLPAKPAPWPKPTVREAPTGLAARAEVMVIDDEPNIIATIERVLVSQHQVVGFTSARDALERLASGKSAPDIIFCDLMMPELSGPEFFTRLRAKNPSVAERVVFITGGAFTPAAQEFLDAVKPPLIDKPFKPDELRRAVAERLEANRGQADAGSGGSD